MNANSQEWNWKVGNGGNNGRYSQASCVIGPGPDANILWDYCTVSSFWPHQLLTYDEILVADRTFNIGNTLHGTYIVAYNLIDGTELWTKDLPVDFASTDWRNRVCGISETMVFATRSGNTNASYLYALDIENGDMVWKSEALVDMSSSEGVIYADNGDLLVGNFYNVTRIDVSDGTTVWQTTRNSPTSGGSELARYNDHVYGWAASGNGPKISVFDVNTGSLLYESRGIGGGFIQQLGPLAGPHGMVYAPRAQNNELTDTLVAFSDTGYELKEEWKLEMGWVPYATHGVGPDSSFYMYSREFQILRIKESKGIISSNDINYTANQKYIDVNLNSINGSICNNEPGYIKINFFKNPKDSPVPIDTSIFIGDENAVFNDPKMAIDAEGNIFLSNGYNDVFCFDPELNLIWTESITDVGGPALAKNGHLAFPAEGNVIKVYEGIGNICPTTYAVTFYVHDQFNNPLMGANVDIGTQSLDTDENGEAIFDIEEGVITYAITYFDESISGTYTVTAEPNQIIDIEFTLTSITNNKSFEPQIFPNPTSEKITIILNKGFMLTITDINGKIVRKQELIKYQNTIDLSKLKQSVYFLKLKNIKEVFQTKLIKL